MCKHSKPESRSLHLFPNPNRIQLPKHYFLQMEPLTISCLPSVTNSCAITVPYICRMRCLGNVCHQLKPSTMELYNETVSADRCDSIYKLLISYGSLKTSIEHFCFKFSLFCISDTGNSDF